MELPFVLGALTVMLGLIVVAVQMYRNGAPTESIAQVLHETEHPAKRS
jgi:hypothetical protein